MRSYLITPALRHVASLLLLISLIPACSSTTLSGLSELPASRSACAAGLHSTEAEDASYETALYSEYELSVGGLALGNFDTNVQISRGGVAGALLDLEDLLGVDRSSTVLRADARYALSPRRFFKFSYYDIRRSGSAKTNDPLVIGEVTIPAGKVDTTFDTSIFKLAYQYNFVAEPRTTIGASFGFHTMRISTSYRSSLVDIGESFRATAPLPMIGLHGAYALSEDWSLGASTEVFQIDIGGDYRGSVVDTLVRLEHSPYAHLGWGLALNTFTMEAELSDGKLKAETEYGYQGLLLYLRTFF